MYSNCAILQKLDLHPTQIPVFHDKISTINGETMVSRHYSSFCQFALTVGGIAVIACLLRIVLSGTANVAKCCDLQVAELWLLLEYDFLALVTHLSSQHISFRRCLGRHRFNYPQQEMQLGLLRWPSHFLYCLSLSIEWSQRSNGGRLRALAHYRYSFA